MVYYGAEVSAHYRTYHYYFIQFPYFNNSIEIDSVRLYVIDTLTGTTRDSSGHVNPVGLSNFTKSATLTLKDREEVMINVHLAEIQVIDSGKSEMSKSNIEIATSAFHELIEKKNMSVYSELMHRELKIRKNNEIWNYDQTFEYIRDLNSKYRKVTFLPFEMVIATGDYVTVKYTERMFSEDGSVESHRFISIFEIRDGRILNIWELAVAVDEDPKESAESGIPLTQIDNSGNQVGGTDQL